MFAMLFLNFPREILSGTLGWFQLFLIDRLFYKRFAFFLYLESR